MKVNNMKDWVKARNRIIKQEKLKIQKPKGHSKQLLNASKICNDEFYTKTETAKLLIDPFLSYLKDKRIICPCDSTKSKIYLYLKSKGLNVKQAENFEMDYSKFDVVITNHPWSKTKKFFEAIQGKKYLIIGNAIAPTSNHFKKWGKYWSKSISTDWLNTPKKVHCRFYSNIKNVWRKEKGETVKNNILYKSDCLNHTSRLDFILCNELVGDRITFKRFLFGKPTKFKVMSYRHVANTGSFKRDYTPDSKGSVHLISYN